MLARRGGGSGSGQVDVGPWPEAAQVAHGQVDRQPHLARHDDEDHVPSHRRYYEEEGAAGLEVEGLFVRILVFLRGKGGGGSESRVGGTNRARTLCWEHV